jgi:hypothetical protein
MDQRSRPDPQPHPPAEPEQAQEDRKRPLRDVPLPPMRVVTKGAWVLRETSLPMEEVQRRLGLR